jgi:hypothetical protein
VPKGQQVPQAQQEQKDKKALMVMEPRATKVKKEQQVLKEPRAPKVKQALRDPQE